MKILKLRSNTEGGIIDLVKIVDLDPSLSAQIMSWASSAYYSAPGEVTNVQYAICRVLGFDLAMNLSLGLTLGESIKEPKRSPKGYLSYWHECIWVSTAMSELIKYIPKSKRPDVGLTYLTGLLHNFGYLVISHVFSDKYIDITTAIETNPEVDTDQIEYDILGVTREQLGSVLMDVWKVPNAVGIGIRYQKDASYKCEHSAYANLCYLARNLLIERGVEIGVSSDVPKGLYKRLGIDPFDASAAMDTILNLKGNVEGLVSMLRS
jgi:HD-like signal output (HDOD) protein